MKCSLFTLFLSAHILFLQSTCSIIGRPHGHRHALNHPRSLTSVPRTVNPTPIAMNATTRMDKRQHPSSSLDIIRDRRVNSIVGSLRSTKKDIPAWLSTLQQNGKWPDSEVDYATGCAARRANWPAQEHWIRLVIMAAAWRGGLMGAEEYAGDERLRAAISSAIDYWFSRDFTNLACLDSGGKPACSCDNHENWLWNTNWYSNVILIPGLVGRTCLLLRDTLSSSQLRICTRMTIRSYEYNVDGLTGANTLDVCRIGIDQALLTSDEALLADAYRRLYRELRIMNDVRADGIRADGAFGQHDGILYNGNYGKDFVNAMLGFGLESAETEFAANMDARIAFATLIDGDRWMIFRNSLTGVLHWDFSVLGRFISFPVADFQATGSIKISLGDVGQLGQEWQSHPLVDFEHSLSIPTEHANAGNLLGNRMFYTNDYMVHRGPNYVTTVKMWSSRTKHTECTNSQNPFGFHLADGVLYTYVQGNEYEDISASWDWNLIPGTTTDYGNTPLTCANTKRFGIESFVGGASTGQIGIAAMQYTNPSTRALRWRKAWFFLDDDVQHIMISSLSSTSSAPVYSVLDQRRLNGPVYIDGVEHSGAQNAAAQTLWHGGVGYMFSGTRLSVQVGRNVGDWSTIGTSTQPPTTVDLFSAWLSHDTEALSQPISYTVFPGTSPESFATKGRHLRLRTVQNDAHISAIFDEVNETFMAVFWDFEGGSVIFPDGMSMPVTISASAHAAVIYRMRSGDVTVSDPSQGLSSVKIAVVSQQSTPRILSFVLPRGGLAGSSVTKNVWA
ncbi:polysaccharide lyase family 8 protein [Collybia nuda]|uniref:Polysaccharide lyase family 8 protein n=1 Tax=Collybia nuda TaxID=64659 RepID=A0A9P5YA15_9AGAR|nr:polysaccharide lyase family 8 protein [Collybia nuda]